MAKKAPLGVKLIALLLYLGAISLVAVGIIMLTGSNLIAPLISAYAPNAGASVAGGIVIIAVAIFGFILGLKLRRGSNGARLIVIVLSVLGVIGSISNLSTNVAVGIIWLVINGLVLWYLAFKKSAVAYFD